MGISKTFGRMIGAGLGLGGLLAYKTLSPSPQKQTIDFKCNAVPPSMRKTKEIDYWNPFKLKRTDNLSGLEKLAAKLHNAALLTYNPFLISEYRRNENIYSASI